MTGLVSFKKKVRVGFILSFLLLLVSFFLVFYVQQRMVKQTGQMLHNYTIISSTESLKSALTEAETGVRGYVLTQDNRFLKPYNDAVKKIPILYNELKGLVKNDPDQQKRLDSLDILINKKLGIMAIGLTNFEESGLKVTDEMRSRRQASLDAMDSIRLFTNRIETAERTMIQNKQGRLPGLLKGANTMAIVSLVIMIISLLYSLITFNYEHKEREKSDDRADKYYAELENNINELKEKNAELKQLKELEKFTSTGRIARTIAHEVRNPLTNILLATEQLRPAENKNEESNVLLDLINRNATRINQLVSELLNATRFTQLDFEKIEVNQLVNDTLEMAKDRIELNKVTVTKNYYTGTCEISVDHDKMKVALLNIIVNAIEAMETDGRLLEIKTARHGNQCMIEISDSGKGMDEDIIQKIFEPYFTDKLKGNGLGLTNTQNIILNHNGKILVQSKPGKGTVFKVTLNFA